MFDPVKNRQDYGEMMKPPFGYELEFSVGTTYSLDLNALIGVSMALGLGQNTDTDLSNNPICLMEALLKASDNLVVFCQKGQIKDPSKPGLLHAFLEKTVVEIKSKSGLNFHPKVWVMKYINPEKESVYRCVVMSRNLTFDRSWDVVACLEGRIMKEEQEKAKPLKDFLLYLSSKIDSSDLASKKKKSIRKLAREVGRVEFNLEGTHFRDYRFLPLGIRGYGVEDTSLKDTYNEALVITPFLTSSVIKNLNGRSLTHDGPHTLITRKSELCKLKESDCNQFKIYVLKDLIVDGEDAVNEGKIALDDFASSKQDIHGKLYLLTKNSRSRLLIGSANATYNAFNGNVEFMLELESQRRYLMVDSLKKSLFGEDEKDSPFDEISPGGAIDEKDEVVPNVKDLMRKVVNLKMYGEVLSNGERYNLRLSIPRAEEDMNEGHITIAPMFGNIELPLAKSMLFEEISIEKLTTFFRIRVQGREVSLCRLIKIEIKGMPEDRDSVIIRLIVKDRRTFMAYLNFILEDDALMAFIDGPGERKTGTSQQKSVSFPAVYEKMLKACIHSPEKFSSIERLIGLVQKDDTDLIPEEFIKLYETFGKVVKQNAKRS